jgi:hypothetical protein
LLSVYTYMCVYIYIFTFTSDLKEQIIRHTSP